MKRIARAYVRPSGGGVDRAGAARSDHARAGDGGAADRPSARSLGRSEESSARGAAPQARRARQIVQVLEQMAIYAGFPQR